MATFTAIPVNLQQLLNEIQTGDIQLPDFQRSWVWNDEKICKLLASVSSSHPIGALMMLQTGNPNVNFSSRPLEGVDFSKGQPQARELILDGQQRLTSLFLTLLSGKAVNTKDARNKPVDCWYYIDIEKAIDRTIEREEAIISMPGKDGKKQIITNFGKHIKLDLSDEKQEYQNKRFPLNQIFDYFEWQRQYLKHWNFDDSITREFDKFTKVIIQAFQGYSIPIISLNSNTPIEAICQVFENVNTSGVTLTGFELLTATFAVENFQLRTDWEIREKKLKEYPVLEKTKNTDFLQAVTLVTTYHDSKISCKGKDILELKLVNYETYADKVMKGFEKVAKLLENEKIFYSRDLPYQTQPIALAAIYTILEDLADNVDSKAKLLRWYWCGVFGEMYGSATDTRLTKDVSQVIDWIKKGKNEPDTIKEANFVASRILELSTRNSVAYKGLAALITQSGCCDFRTGLTIDQSIDNGESIDIHHIFPKRWFAGKAFNDYDCIVNKTPLTATTNRKIGGNSPSQYINDLQNGFGILDGQMEERLRTHLIEPSVFRADDYQTFFDKRKYALLGLIGKAMGKSVVYPAS